MRAALLVGISALAAWPAASFAQDATANPKHESIKQLQAFLDKVDAKDYAAAAVLVTEPVGIPSSENSRPGDYQDIAAADFMPKLGLCKLVNMTQMPASPDPALVMVATSWKCSVSLRNGAKQQTDVTFALVSQGKGIRIINFNERESKIDG